MNAEPSSEILPKLEIDIFEQGRYLLENICGSSGKNLDIIDMLESWQMQYGGEALTALYSAFPAKTHDELQITNDLAIIDGFMNGISVENVCAQTGLDKGQLHDSIDIISNKFRERMDWLSLHALLVDISRAPRTKKEPKSQSGKKVTVVKLEDDVGTDESVFGVGMVAIGGTVNESDSDETNELTSSATLLPIPATDTLKLTSGVNRTIKRNQQSRSSKHRPRPSNWKGERRSKERVDDNLDLFGLYLVEIGRIPLLTKDEEVSLAQTIVAGNEAQVELDSGIVISAERKAQLRTAIRRGADANEHFIRANLRLVVSIAKKYQISGLPLPDLVQEGNTGLIHAVEKFDWRKGFKFSTYATWWIRQAITRGIANTGRMIRVPVHVGELLKRLQQVRSELELELGRPTTLAEIAARAEMPEDRVADTLALAAEPMSLNEHLSDDKDSAELGDIVEDRTSIRPDEEVLSTLLPEAIAKMFDMLDDKERTILIMRFGLDRGEPRTLQEVGECFNLTRERIRQIEARAMSKLRHPSANIGAHAFLE